MEYETVIGLEVHAQLLTKSKMFCRCSADYANAPPNTHVCPVCLGMPGVLPTINEKALEYTAMTGLALNCEVAGFSRFDRKNYPYPDLMKGYQISQYDLPICQRGWLPIELDGETKRVGITRVHLEEDTAKLVHRTNELGETYSLVDVNRAGTPLMEIVGEPDIRSPEEARQYLIKLRAILQYLGVSTGNMEEGSFRCDANVSIRPRGSAEFMTKVEVKNMNSFRAVYRALAYEVERQTAAAEAGERLVQETRGWVEEKGVTVSQRSKEYAHDYRYFPEPDLPPMAFSRQWVEDLLARLPELPDARRERFMKEVGLSLYDASLLTASRDTAEYFEACLPRVPRGPDASGPAKAAPASLQKRAKVVSNWMLGDFARLLNARGLEIGQAKIRPEHLCVLLDLIDQGTISGKIAKDVFEEMFDTGKTASQIVTEKGITQISDASQVEAVVAEVVKANPQAVADYKAGKQQSLVFLVGQVMKATRGRANPKLVNQLLEERLEAAG
ncbi:MAG: Asp-tRNA(Asn)/Glu-tRNA(Gln) amidotransferase subunit GatB [Chloroflexi bacterium]|nr:Asp-tRNA(Asn)/Glu-tRNA(Gln) amidotransferase subunit GatB [Chloroflexota bacterium]